jgi:fatty acid desaturase
MKKVDYYAVDQEVLAKDIDEIKKTIGDPTYDDFKHLKKMERWGTFSTITGYIISAISPYLIPVGAFLMSIGNFSRWANVAHPILHSGYDKVPNIPEKYKRKVFAKGKRRFIDWLDWIVPKSWEYEHNTMHHYHLGEKDDPDNVELNMEWLHKLNIPMWLKYTIVIIFASMWKFLYYAPNTLKILGNLEKRKKGEKEEESFLRLDAWNPFKPDGKKLWLKSFLPYLSIKFILIPALFLPFGIDIALNIFYATILAEVMTNLHSFLVIVPNHSAEDVYRFEEPYKTQGEFYLRQILGSANYNTGGNLRNFMHGWLNYQIEHHLFPNLPLSQYEAMAPLVKEVCKKHNIPYRQENVFKRMLMTLDLMVGKTKLLRVKTF